MLVAIGKSREDDPLRVLDEAFWSSRGFDLRHVNVCAGMAYPGRGAQDHRRFVGLRKGEGILHRLKRLLRTVAVEDRDAGVLSEMACVLFRLG